MRRKAGWTNAQNDASEKRRREYFAAHEARLEAKNPGRKVRQRVKYLANAKVSNRKYKLAKHGASTERYAQLLVGQCNACAICKGPFLDKTPHIDHCHATGQLRGLLCRQCNLVLGFSKDAEATLFAAVDYLRRANFDRV